MILVITFPVLIMKKKDEGNRILPAAKVSIFPILPNTFQLFLLTT